MDVAWRKHRERQAAAKSVRDARLMLDDGATNTVQPFALHQMVGIHLTANACASHVLAHHPTDPILAFPAGTCVVLYSTADRCQLRLLTAARPSTTAAAARGISCVAFSSCGRFLAAGERLVGGIGSSTPACVYVWEVATGKVLKKLRAAKGSGTSVACVTFSQGGKHLVSATTDSHVSVWEWRQEVVVGVAPKQAEALLAVACSEDASTVFTAGASGHCKAWGLPPVTKGSSHHSTAAKAMVPKYANLREYRSTAFVDVRTVPPSAVSGTTSSGTDSAATYALTEDGTIVLLRASGRGVERSVSLKVRQAFGLAASGGRVAAACADGVVRLFAARSLQFLCNLPSKMPAGQEGQERDVGCIAGSTPHADAIACSFSGNGEQLTVCYADHTIRLWDLRDPKQITSTALVSSHSACIWDAAVIPAHQAAGLCDSTACGGPLHQQQRDQQQQSQQQRQQPTGCPANDVLVTCSSDGTIRMWDLADSSGAHADQPTRPGLRGVLTARTTDGGGVAAPPPALSVRDGAVRGHPDSILLPAPSDTKGRCSAAATTAAAAVVLSCLCLSPTGCRLAVGDVKGNLRVYDLVTMRLLEFKEAHDSEVLSVAWTSVTAGGTELLVSGGRDSLIHVYGTSEAGGSEVVDTLDEHAAAVTKVAASGSGTKLISCGADMAVIFRSWIPHAGSPAGGCFDMYHREQLSCGVLLDLAVNAFETQVVVLAAGGQLNVLDVAQGHVIKCLQLQGEVTRVALEPYSRFALCAVASGTVTTVDLDTGRLLAGPVSGDAAAGGRLGGGGGGHAEAATGVYLAASSNAVVTTGSDGCIAVWRLPPVLADMLAPSPGATAEGSMLEKTLNGRHVDDGRDGAGGLPCTPRNNSSAMQSAGGDQGGALAEPDEVVLRVQQGQPLMSLQRLPKWARKHHHHQELATAGEGNTPAGSSDSSGGTVSSDGRTPVGVSGRAVGGARAALAASRSPSDMSTGGTPISAYSNDASARRSSYSHSPPEHGGGDEAVPQRGDEAVQLGLLNTPAQLETPGADSEPQQRRQEGLACPQWAGSLGGWADPATAQRDVAEGTETWAAGRMPDERRDQDVDTPLSFAPYLASSDGPLTAPGQTIPAAPTELATACFNGGPGVQLDAFQDGTSDDLRDNGRSGGGGGGGGVAASCAAVQPLRRELFRHRFDALDQISCNAGGVVAALGGEAGGQREARRQSLSATYRLMRDGYKSGASMTSETHPCSTTDPSTLGTPLSQCGSNNFGGAAAAMRSPMGAGRSAVGGTCVTPASGTQQRVAGLGTELSKMSDRLNSMQKAFEERQARLTPWRAGANEAAGTPVSKAPGLPTRPDNRSAWPALQPVPPAAVATVAAAPGITATTALQTPAESASMAAAASLTQSARLLQAVLHQPTPAYGAPSEVTVTPLDRLVGPPEQHLPQPSGQLVQNIAFDMSPSSSLGMSLPGTHLQAGYPIQQQHRPAGAVVVADNSSDPTGIMAHRNALFGLERTPGVSSDRQQAEAVPATAGGAHPPWGDTPHAASSGGPAAEAHAPPHDMTPSNFTFSTPHCLPTRLDSQAAVPVSMLPGGVASSGTQSLANQRGCPMEDVMRAQVDRVTSQGVAAAQSGTAQSARGEESVAAVLVPPVLLQPTPPVPLAVGPSAGPRALTELPGALDRLRSAIQDIGALWSELSLADNGGTGGTATASAGGTGGATDILSMFQRATAVSQTDAVGTAASGAIVVPACAAACGDGSTDGGAGGGSDHAAVASSLLKRARCDLQLSAEQLASFAGLLGAAVPSAASSGVADGTTTASTTASART